MNAFVSSALLSQRSPSDVIEHADGSADFTVSPQLACHYDRSNALLWTNWAPRGVPSFNPELLHELERGSQLIEGHFSGKQKERPLQYVVLRSAIAGVFSTGGDLGYFQRLIVAQDRARLTEYARAAIDVVYRNYTSHNLHGVTTIALLEGDALGGGFECALSCDVLIAEKHVKAGFPEILFNMFPGMGGMSFLSRRVNRSVSEEMVRSGRQYSAQELLELGLIDQVVETGEGRNAVMSMIQKREHQTSGHNAINACDRLIRPITMQELHGVVKLWVDCALQMSPRSLEWMQRLHQRQLAIFGRPLEVASDEATYHAQDIAAAA